MKPNIKDLKLHLLEVNEEIHPIGTKSWLHWVSEQLECLLNFEKELRNQKENMEKNLPLIAKTMYDKPLRERISLINEILGES